MAIITGTGTGPSDWPHDADGHDDDTERAWLTLDTGLRAAIVAHFPGWPADGSAWSLDGAPATEPDLPAVPPVSQVPAEPPPRLPDLPGAPDAPTAPMLPTIPAVRPVPAGSPPAVHGPSPQNTYLAAQQAALVASLRSVAGGALWRRLVAWLAWIRAQVGWLLVRRQMR